VMTMAAEMAVATALLWSRLQGPFRVLLPCQTAIMFLAPPVFSSGDWVEGSIVAGSVVMIVLYVYQMEFLYRHRELGVRFSRYLVALLGAYALMMMALVVWQVYGWAVPFAISLLVEMAVYLGAVLPRPAPAPEVRVAWQLRPTWTFGVLLLIFVSELAMGAALDLELQPAQFAGAFFALPLSGAGLTVLYNAVFDGFWFFANVAGSTWFLAMMGAEMGALVVFKWRETRDRETRVRLALMMGSYASFAVFFPSIYYGLVFPHGPGASDVTTVPVLGWSMGIGSAPLAASVFGVLLFTYAATAVLSIFFGRRWVCSLFCTAPMMYQGTTLDAMKSFNHDARVGRKYLGSRFSTTYSVTLTVVMVALALTSLTSYLDQTGTLSVTVLGADPSVFLFVLSFNVVWYVLFVTIPYVGNYNCVTMGWCYTGNIAAAFGRIGFFRLKVKDREVCRRCTTIDCARACPVGLVDMPGHFRQKGEFRSSKCCGVGDCVGVCPYGNLYIHDVRHWWRRLRGHPEVPDASRRLPMVSLRAAVNPPAPLQGATSTVGPVTRP